MFRPIPLKWSSASIKWRKRERESENKKQQQQISSYNYQISCAMRVHRSSIGQSPLKRRYINSYMGNGMFFVTHFACVCVCVRGAIYNSNIDSVYVGCYISFFLHSSIRSNAIIRQLLCVLVEQTKQGIYFDKISKPNKKMNTSNIHAEKKGTLKLFLRFTSITSIDSDITYGGCLCVVLTITKIFPNWLLFFRSSLNDCV